MDKISKGLISLVIASLLAGPFITVVAEMDEAGTSESVVEEIAAEEISEEIESESTLPLAESLEIIEDDPVDEYSDEPSTKEEVTVVPINLNIKDGIRADDLTLLKEGRANPWLMKLDWEKINPFLAQLDELSRLEAIDKLKQSQIVLTVNGSEMARVKLDEFTQVTFDISESLPKGTVLEFDIPEIKAETFTMNFDTLKIVVEGIAEEVIVLEDALRPWDLAAIEAGKKGKWSIDFLEEALLDGMKGYRDIDQEQLMKLITESDMNMSVDGELYSKLVIGDMGVATFDILEDLPQGSVVTFSIADIAWQEENGLEFKLEIPPLVIEVIGMEEKPMTAAKMDVLASATSREITMYKDEWIRKSGLLGLNIENKVVDSRVVAQVTGYINTLAIHQEISAIPNTTYSENVINRTNTMNEIAKAKIFVKINNQYVKLEDGNPQGFALSRGMMGFEFEIPAVKNGDVITFELGPSIDQVGRVSVFDRYFVNFESHQLTFEGVQPDNASIPSNAIVIDSATLPVGSNTQTISGYIDDDEVKEYLKLEVLESINIDLNILLNLLEEKQITLQIFDEENNSIHSKSKILGEGLRFEFDVSDVNLKVGHRLVLSVESFILDFGLIALNTSFHNKILFIEDIEISSVSPNIDFGSIEFTYQGVKEVAANDGMQIKLTDNRSLAESEWQLSAQASGDALNNSIITFRNGSLESDKGLLGYEVSSLNLIIGKESKPFAHYKKPATGGNVGIVHWTLSYAAEDILLTIPPEVMMNLSDDTYHMNISWTLTKGP